MERKKYDLFANLLSNPQSSMDNLITSGLSIDNTSLLDRSVYENNDKIREAFKDNLGEFDKTRFDAFYNNSKVFYNYLALTNYNEAIKQQATFHRDNMSVEPEKRRQGPDFTQLKVSNPRLILSGIIHPGLSEDLTKSDDEIMLSNHVLLNPTTAGENLENAQWGDSPNENFSGYFFDTLVQARYKEAGYHRDLLNNQMVKHEAGELKLDNTGNFYYERLDGRDIYDKKVLNKMNVLTTDGSWANKYLDFMDSDDIELKSVMGSIMKNLALVGTMWIPYVGPWIAGISIATQLAGLFGTFGKMLVGSDSPTLSALEGWSKSMNRQNATTEYAQQHPWCFENMINLAGDVFGLLYEQRVLFTKVPQLFKGASMINKENEAIRLKALTDKHYKLLKESVANLEKNGVLNTDLINSTAILQARAASAAQAEMDSFIKGYNKIGEIISRGYMTGITVQDTYGEAKAAGASDLDATLLTLGYTIGEYLLLRTGLGRWNIPETRLNLYRNLAIARALTLLLNETKQSAFLTAKNQLANLSTKEGKKLYIKKVLGIGKNLAKDVWSAEKSNGTKTLSAVLNSAAGEGVEEVSEEILADFSKGCYDVIKWLNGEDIRLNTFGYDFQKGEWNGSEVFDRYALSLIGGAIGGGLANISTNYKMIDSYNGMTHNEAVKLLVSMARNGEIGDFMKDVNKILLDTPNLSTNFEVINDQIVFNPGTKTDNRDLTLKRAIQLLVDIIQGILSANGAVSDNQFLDRQTLGDLRFAALQNSTTTGAYLDEYNTLLSEIVQETITLSKLAKRDLDANNDGVVTDKEERHNEVTDSTKEDIKRRKKLIEEKKKQLDDLVSGKRAAEFIATALWETTPFLSGTFTTVTFPLYVERKYGKKYLDLTDEEKTKAVQEYKNWKTTVGRDEILTLALNFLEFLKLFSLVVQNHAQLYLNSSKDILDISKYIITANNALNQLFTVEGDLEVLITPNEFLQNLQEDVDNPVGRMSDQISKLGSELISIFGNDEQKAQLQDLIIRRELAIKDFDELFNLELEEIEDPEAKLTKLQSYNNELKLQHLSFNKELTKLVYDTLVNNLHGYVLTILQQGFLPKETKNQLSLLLDLAYKVINNFYMPMAEKSAQNEAAQNGKLLSWDWINPMELIANQLFLDNRAIQQLNETPLEQNFNNFAISIGQNPINITQLIQKLNDSFNEVSDDVTNFLVEALYTELNNTILTLELYKATIQAARTDNANLNNLFGFNAILNEASAKVEGAEKLNLAEIDKNIADLFTIDIDSALSKLNLLKRLHKINQGLKLSKLDRVSAKKDLLNYKRIKYIVSILDDLDDWDEESKVKFKATIESLSMLLDMLENNSVIAKDNEAFLRLVLAMENAIYDFFQANSDVLSDPVKLAQLINPSKLDLYTKADILLNEDLEAIDDNSFVWWLASRAALKAQDFYFQYKEIIDPKAEKSLVPIATLELAIYNNYASIVNGNVFNTFYLAMRISIAEDWQKKSADDRKTVLKKLDKSEKFAEEKFAKFALNFLPAPRYSNIMLTEGIPGSGKTAATFKTTIQLLKKYHPDILKDVIIAHGANPDSAKGIQNNVELETAKTFGRNELMKYIYTNWAEYRRNPDNSYIIPNTEYEITSENEIVNKHHDKVNKTDHPSLIIIDEISKFTSYDLDLIDQFAKENGITVLVAGDFDLSCATGSHNIPSDHTFDGFRWQVELERTNFVRSPKLGVSMRTDNVFKTNNLIKTQLYLLNPNGVLDLEYAENEEGLFGDKVFHYDLEFTGETATSTKNNLTDLILEEIKKLKETLKDGEKIGYIYTDKNSKLYEELSKLPYVDAKEGSAALGLEGRYYIIDLGYTSNDPDLKSFLKDLYTGISRALLGSLIITPYGDPTRNKFVPIKSTLKSEVPIKETLETDVIRQYAQKRKDVLDKIIPEGNVPDIILRTQLTSPILPSSGVSQADLDAQLQQAIEAEKLSLILAISQANSEQAINDLITNSKYAQLGSDLNILAVKNLRLTELLEINKYLNFVNLLHADILKTTTIDDLETLILLALEQYPDIMLDIESIYNTRKELINIKNLDLEAKDLYIANVIDILANVETLEDLDRLINEVESRYPGILNEELSKVFDTARISIQEKLKSPINTPQPEPDIHDDDLAPVTNTDIIDTAQLRSDIDSLNEDPTPPESNSSLTDNSSKILINMLLHSFNTFETGVLEGENGEIILIGTPEQIAKRIDSVNGIIKIDNLLGNSLRSLQEYVNMLGDLRSIIFNTPEKSEIESILASYFGLANIYTTFALKSSPRINNNSQTDENGYFGNQATPYNKSKYEKTLFNGSNDVDSKNIHDKSIVIIIGSNIDGKNQNLLELPLLALSSPFTLLQVKNGDVPAFSEILDTFEREANKQNPNWRTNKQLNLVSIAQTIITEHENNPQYKEIIDLFKLYLKTGGFIKYIRDKQWTPAKALLNTGAHVINSKGYRQILPGLDFNDETNPLLEWVSLADFAGSTKNNKLNLYHNPSTYTTLIFISDHADFDGIDKPVVNPGHPFVLVSFDNELRDDISVIKQYLELLKNPTIPKKVVLVYILPPKATVSEYLDNLYKIVHKLDGILSIGYFTTIFKLLKTLSLDLEFKDLVNRKLNIISSKLFQELDAIPDNAKIEELNIRLNETRDWSKEGIGNGPQTLKYLFRRALNKLISIDQTITDNIHKKDDLVISLIESIANRNGVDGVYHHFAIPKSDNNSNGFFFIPEQGGTENPYTLDGKPCLIHGKVDSYTFLGYVGDIISQLLASNPNNSNHVSARDNLIWKTPDNPSYNNGNSNLNDNPIRNKLDKDRNDLKKEISDIIKHVLDKTDIRLDPKIFEGKTLMLARINIADLINLSNNSNIAFIINGMLLITNSYPLIQGNNKVIYSNGLSVTDISSLVLTNGEANFEISIDGKMYQALLNKNSGLLEIWELNVQQPTNNPIPTLSATPQNVLEYLQEANNLFLGTKVLKADIKLMKVFKAITYDEFIKALTELHKLGPAKLNPDITLREYLILQATDGKLLTSLQQQIVNDLLAMELYKRLEKDNNPNICPTTIKLKF